MGTEREKNCKWFFSDQPSAGQEVGPNNAMTQNFKKHPYASLVRESIQNSLDAVLDKSQPVRIRYEFRTLKCISYPNFFELKEHIQGCLDYYPKNSNAKDNYKPMLSILDPSLSEISYVRVSDFNTKGMNYDENDTNSSFYAFVRSAGVSAKENAAAGGSFGFGKAAYFQMSPISTIIVSTRTEDDKTFFEGISSLCTHTFRGDKKMAVGYYDNSNGKPIAEETEIPPVFRRAEPGTDVNILGMDVSEKDDIKREMAEAVLRNFWMAIHDNKLVVEIGNGISITKDNLGSMMDEYFPDEDDNSKWKGYDNPRPYYEAYRNCGTSEKYVKKTAQLSLLGNVCLFLNIKKNANDKIAYLRDLQMLVYSKNNKTNYGFYGVFFCGDPKGNEILRKLENPAHNEWNIANWELKSSKKYGREALKEIEEFKSQALKEIFESKNKKAIEIKGLEEFLYIPTSFDEEDDIYKEIEEISDVSGNESGQTTDIETGAYTTDIPEEEDNPQMDKPVRTEPQGHVAIHKQTNAVSSTTGTLRSGHGDAEKKPKAKGIEKPGNRNDVRSESQEGNPGIYSSPIQIPYRSFSQVEGNTIYHYVVLHSDEEIDKVCLRFFGVGEESNEELHVAYTNEGVVSDKGIENVHIQEGRTRLKVRFTDGMMHSLKLSAVEINEVQ